MALTITDTLRSTDAARMRERFAAAHQALAQLSATWSMWADSVRQDAEHRQGAAAGAGLAEDAELWFAMDVRTALMRAKTAVLDAEARFSSAEDPAAGGAR
jgi:hypothetical protein